MGLMDNYQDEGEYESEEQEVEEYQGEGRGVNIRRVMINGRRIYGRCTPSPLYDFFYF